MSRLTYLGASTYNRTERDTANRNRMLHRRQEYVTKRAWMPVGRNVVNRKQNCLWKSSRNSHNQDGARTRAPGRPLHSNPINHKQMHAGRSHTAQAGGAGNSRREHPLHIHDHDGVRTQTRYMTRHISHASNAHPLTSRSPVGSATPPAPAATHACYPFADSEFSASSGRLPDAPAPAA